MKNVFENSFALLQSVLTEEYKKVTILRVVT